MRGKPPIWAYLAVVGGVAAINVAALVLLVIADGGIHNLSLIPFAPIPTSLACGGVLLSRNSRTGFVFATVFSVEVCALSALGIIVACGDLFGWEPAEAGESAAWMWLFQIPFATLALLSGFVSLFFRQPRDQSAS